MKKGLIATFMVALMLITVLSAVVSVNAVFIRKESSKDRTAIDKELIEIPVQIHGLNGVENYKSYITQQQADELEVLISEFKANLDNSKNIDETIMIYKDMVMSLDEIDLLPKSLSIEKVQDLVTGRKPESILSKSGNLALNFINHLYKLANVNDITTIVYDDTTFYGDIYENNNCFLSFYSTNTDMYLTLSPSDMLKLLIFMVSGIILGKIYFGRYIESTGYPYPADGWIHTNRPLSSDKWTYEGKFWGHLETIWEPPAGETFCIGVKGFTGLYLKNLGFIYGYASQVKIGTSKPE